MFVGLEIDVPVPLHANIAALACHRDTRGLQLGDALHDATGCGRRQRREQVAYRFPVEGALHILNLKDRLHLRREEQLAVAFGVVERLDAQAIACKQHLPLARIPDGEGEHPPEAVHASGTEILVEMNDGFRVAGGAEDMAMLLEIPAQLAIVVDLAVEHDPDRAVLVGDRLESIVEVNDAQAAHADGHAVAHVDALIVGAAMRDDTAHGADLVLANLPSVPANDACDAAHVNLSLPALSG